MDLPVKKNKPPKVTMPPLPVLPALFAQLMPPQIPQLPYKPGVTPILENFVHNWKLLQLERAAEREAAIVEAKARQTRAHLQQVEDMLLFGQRYELDLAKIRHEMEMLDVNKETAEASLVNAQYKNMLAYIEVQKSQLEFQHMLKELGGNGNGGNGNGSSQD